MRAQPEDPRDTRWLDLDPVYRVVFWKPQSGRPDPGWISDEWDVHEADVDEVLTWARADAGGRQFVLYVRTEDDGEAGLLRLMGQEPV